MVVLKVAPSMTATDLAPTRLDRARQKLSDLLALRDKYQFQWWALSLVGARPTEQKKGADRGIDGRLYFHDEHRGGKTKQIVFSVKAGHVQSAYVRDLRGVIGDAEQDREQREVGYQ